MKNFDGSAFAVEAAADIHEAAGICRDEHIGVGGQDTGHFVIDHGSGNLRVADGEGSAKTAALILTLERHISRPRDMCDQFLHFVGLPQESQVARVMVGHAAGELRADIEHTEFVHQKIAKFVGLCGQIQSSRVPWVVRREEVRKLCFHHRSTGAGRNDNCLGICEHADGMLRLFASQIVKAAVKQGLATTGLRRGKIDRVSQVAQQVHRGNTGGGTEYVAQTSDHKGDAHGRCLP